MKNFLLEKRYENDKKSMILILVLSIIIPFYLLIYIPMRLIWRKNFEDIRLLRDEQKEIELLKIIESKKIKNKKYFYAYYALADLGYNQLKELVVKKLLEIDKKAMRTDTTAYYAMEYGKLLAYLIQEEEGH
ncbi:MAG: hypothetical protein FK733_14085 [Asgard group archaeon]|nr:hypothetical protein [Asgard group archaeon]